MICLTLVLIKIKVITKNNVLIINYIDNLKLLNIRAEKLIKIKRS